MNVLDSSGHTWGNWYWPIWLVIVTATFLGPEIYSLITDHGPNTLSAWVWKTLQIGRNETPLQWSAADALTRIAESLHGFSVMLSAHAPVRASTAALIAAFTSRCLNAAGVRLTLPPSHPNCR